MDDEEASGYKILGEIFISPEAALLYAQSHNTNPYEELTLYLIHGILHLLGQDDLSEEDAAQMRVLETKHLAHLRTLSLILS
jgi:probable rRNA maturation factor